MDLNNGFEQRRSIYDIGNRQILPQNEISSLIKHTLKFAPSAFNSQSASLDSYSSTMNKAFAVLDIFGGLHQQNCRF